MEKQARHRPHRQFAGAPRKIVECELERCPHCGEKLKARNTWPMSKTIQTMAGPLFIAGKSKMCTNESCTHKGAHYHASGVLRYSLPQSSYGLDVLAWIGWRHEHEHKQLVEIHCELKEKGILVNERNVGKLYRQFLALVGGLSEQNKPKLAETIAQHGGVIFGLDGLQPEGCGSLLYVLYEVLSGTPVGAIQLENARTEQLSAWLQTYQHYPVLATLSDGEDLLVAALQQTWPEVPHQRCQEHFLGNLAEAVLDEDTHLRQELRESLGGLPKLTPETGAPPFFRSATTLN